LSAHKSAHDNKSKYEFKDNKDEIDDVDRIFMRVFELLNVWNDTQRYAKEECEYDKCNQLRELYECY
jgi:hypothetical protein